MKKTFMGILALVIGLSFSLATLAPAQEPTGTPAAPPTVAPGAPAAPSTPAPTSPAKAGKKKGKKKGKRRGAGKKDEMKSSQ